MSSHLPDHRIQMSVPSGAVGQLQFQKESDRYSHSLVLYEAGAWREVLMSQEGMGQEGWPPSPPFQQLHEQRLPTGPVLWGLGAAGLGHWSGSFAVNPESGEPVSWQVEIAVRSPANPSWIGSTYRMLSREITVRQASDCQVYLSTPCFEIQIETQPENARLVCPSEGQLLVIEPVQPWSPQRRTVTWSYRIGYCPLRV